MPRHHVVAFFPGLQSKAPENGNFPMDTWRLSGILKDAALGKHFAGQEFQDIKALYDEYCRKTNWIIKSPVKAFFPKNETGKGFTTKCFGIQFEDGATDRFSLDKALSAVAN